MKLTTYLHQVPEFGTLSTGYIFMAWYLVKHRNNFVLHGNWKSVIALVYGLDDRGSRA
jgi:hypothetical protein